jgi:prophage DNA circulation protein
MEDQWSTQLYESSFGGVRLDVQSTTDDLSRALVRYKYPNRDGADVADMGAEEWVTRCRLIFWPRDGQDARAAFLGFMEVVKRGRSQVFSHPIFGERNCKVGQLSAAAEFGTRDVIMVEAEFVEDTVDAATFPTGAGAPVASSVQEIAAISADIDSGLVDVNEREDLDEPISTDVGKDAVTAVTGWSEDESLTERDVRYEAASLAADIEAETDRLELATHLDRYPLVAAFARLHFAIRNAAEAFIQRSPKAFEITVPAPTPLLVIAAQTYGADQAGDRYEELLELNDIRTPNRIPAGTVLKARVDDRSTRLRRPRAA